MTATISKDHRYQVRLNPKMDENMVDLANRLGKDQAEVFHKAMRLYIAVKNQQLKEIGTRFFYETPEGKIVEIVNI